MGTVWLKVQFLHVWGIDFWMFGDTTHFKTNHLQWFEKNSKMEFLNLLCHLPSPALLQSSLVEYDNFVMLFLAATSFVSLCMAVISVQYTNMILFRLHDSYCFTLLYWKKLDFCLRMLHIFKIVAAIVVLSS